MLVELIPDHPKATQVLGVILIHRAHANCGLLAMRVIVGHMFHLRRATTARGRAREAIQKRTKNAFQQR